MTTNISSPHPPRPPQGPKPRLGLAARIGLIFGGVMVLAIWAGLSNQADPAPVAQSAPPSTAPRTTHALPTRTPTTTVVAPPVVTAPASPAREVSSRDWAKIARSPDQHVGEHVVIYGEVTQFDAATGDSTLRANVDGARHDQWYEYDTNAILDAPGDQFADVVKDDGFRAEVLIQGSYTYSTAMGGALTVPRLTVVKIEVTS